MFKQTKEEYDTLILQGPTLESEFGQAQIGIRISSG